MRIEYALAAAAVAFLVMPKALASQTREDGAALERRMHVQFAVLPAPWKVETQNMDTIWQPLGLRGVNHYAYAGAVPPRHYAARSDPSSQYYQAWFGVYTVVGDSATRLVTGANHELASVRKLAEYDQRSWLEAMGDPHPLAESYGTVQTQRIMIDGTERTLYLFHMQTHSDLNDGSTPLAHYIGMPGKASRRQLPFFHPVALHGYYAFWYDVRRNATVIVYAASSAYIPIRPGDRHSSTFTDNGVSLDKMLRSMMQGVRIVDASPVTAK